MLSSDLQLKSQATVQQIIPAVKFHKHRSLAGGRCFETYHNLSAGSNLVNLYCCQHSDTFHGLKIQRVRQMVSVLH